MTNSPYEFNNEMRKHFVLSLERLLETKVNNSNKIRNLFKNELEEKLKEEKRQLALNYFKEISDDEETFIKILKDASFTKKTAENLPKYLEQHGINYIINLCKKKNLVSNLDNLFDPSKMDYSVVYMDLILNFLAFHCQIRPEGKNKFMYYKLINQSIAISEMLNEYNNDFEFLSHKKINNIIDALNADEIEYHLNNHTILLIDEINNLVKKMPEIQEYIPEKFTEGIEQTEQTEYTFYKKNYQLSVLNQEDIVDIIKYFEYIYKILQTNKLEHISDKVKDKQKFYEDKYDTCSDEVMKKYEKLVQKCMKAQKKINKAMADSKKYKYIKDIFHKTLVNLIQENMFDFLNTMNHNFDQFIEFKGKTTFIQLGELTYYDTSTEYRVKNNLIHFISEISLMIDSKNIKLIEFIITTILKFLYNTSENNKMSFIGKIFAYDNEERTFSCACMLFSLIKNAILKISNIIKIDDELLTLFKKFSKEYYKHSEPFHGKRNNLTKKQIKIKEVCRELNLSEKIQQQAVNSEFLKLIVLDKNKKKNSEKNQMKLKEWVQFFLPIFEKNIIKKKTTVINKQKKTVDNSVLVKHLDELLFSTVPIKAVEKKQENSKDTYQNFLNFKEERDNLQQLINEFELLGENTEELEIQLKKQDAEIKKLEPKYEFYQEINQEDQAADNCIQINKDIERYRSILSEYKKDEDENIDKIEELEKKIDDCIMQLNYERIHFPTLDRSTGKIQGSNTTTYIPWEEPTFSTVQLTDEGYQLKRKIETFKRQTDKEDKRFQEITKFKNLLKQATNVVEIYIHKLNNFFDLTDEDFDINYTDFSKKIVYQIFDKYWFNSKYCIKSKIEMYFRMYVRNATKSFYQGYTQIVLDLIKIIASIQYLIIFQDKIDMKKLINTPEIILNRIHKNKIFVGRTFEVITGENAGKQGIVFREEDDKVIIKYQYTFIEEPKSNIKRVIVNKDFIGKLVKPIVGNYKGRICMIIGERHDEFQLTVDTYGGTSSKCLGGITYITLKKEQFNVLPNRQQLSVDKTTIREYKKTEVSFNPEKIDLYNCSRCLFDLFGLSISYMIIYSDNSTNDERFNFLYSIGLVLYNKNKINDTTIWHSFVKLNNKLEKLQEKTKSCTRYEKLMIRNKLMSMKKQIEKKQFSHNKNLIFKEKISWDNTEFQTCSLNKISEFNVFENTCNILDKEMLKKRKRKLKLKPIKIIKIDNNEVIKKSISKMESLFNKLTI